MDSLSQAGLNLVIGNPTLTGLSGAATTHSYSAFAITINGIYYAIAANSGVATPTTDAATGAAFLPLVSQKSIFVWLVDSAAGDYVIQGSRLSPSAPDSLITLPLPPNHANGPLIPYAYVVITAGSTSFTFGATNWNAANVVVGTVRNFATLPSRVI